MEPPPEGLPFSKSSYIPKISFSGTGMDSGWDHDRETKPFEFDYFIGNDVISSVSDKLLHLDMGYYNPEEGGFDKYDETGHPSLRPELHMRRVSMSEYPEPLYEIRAGPPYHIDVDAVPRQRQMILLEYNTISRKSSRLIEFYTMDACAMLEDISKMEWKLRKILGIYPIYAELKIDELLKELEDVIKSLEQCSSKAHKSIQVCFEIATWMNKFYAEDISHEKRARRMGIVDRRFNRFKRCLNKAKDCVQTAIIRRNYYETLALTIYNVLYY